MRLADTAEPYLDGAEQVERIEMIGRRLEHAGIDFLGIAQAPLTMQGHRLVEGLAEIEWC